MNQIQVVAAIFQKEGKILIARRKKGKSMAGYWEFPGGKIEGGESQENALKRELREELGVDVEIVKFIQTNIHEYDNFQIHLHAYLVNTHDTVSTSTDHDKIDWILPNEYMSYNIAPADIPIIETFL